MKIQGYKRPDGKVGIRNHLVILPTTVCAGETASAIASQIPGAVPLVHQHGCCQVGADADLTVDTLVGLGKNPNVGAVLVVSLGCEGVSEMEVTSKIAETGKPVESIIIQKEGGTLKTIAKGVKIARELEVGLSLQTREEVDINELILAIECGGSDMTSGVASNPAVGNASDRLLSLGGTAMLSETTELIGAEHTLAKRAVNEEVSNRIYEIVERCEKRAMTLGVDIRGGQPTPGNIEGGIVTIEEKSLGCIYKAGTAPISGVLEYGEVPQGKGFYVMDTPGQDIESITGMLAGGAQIVVFTTGRGTPTGSPIAPVIKVTGNEETYKMMEDNMDINAGLIVSGKATIEDIGEEIFNEIVAVSNGKKTKAEAFGYKEFGLYKIAPTF